MGTRKGYLVVRSSPPPQAGPELPQVDRCQILPDDKVPKEQSVVVVLLKAAGLFVGIAAALGSLVYFVAGR
jgi:hypothetical protein